MRALLDKGADSNTAFEKEFEFDGNTIPAGTSVLLGASAENKLEALVLLDSGADQVIILIQNFKIKY